MRNYIVDRMDAPVTTGDIGSEGRIETKDGTGSGHSVNMTLPLNVFYNLPHPIAAAPCHIFIIIGEATAAARPQ